MSTDTTPVERPRYQPIGIGILESAPLKPAANDSPRDRSACDSTATPITGSYPKQVLLGEVGSESTADR